MAFETVRIQSTRNGSFPITGWRQDLAIGDVVALALSSNTGVSSYRWELVGRPEGSSAGGPGPEPCLLGTGATCSFSVDSDSGMVRDGTYIVHCTVNGGTPTDTIIRVGMARLATGLSFNGLPLRKLGGFERDEDTHEPLVAQESTKMLDRWLGFLQQGTSPAPVGGPSDVADWDITKVRYIFLDGDAGVDTNIGYIDAAPGTDFTSLAATVAAVKVKTTHRVNEIRKRIGAGRMCVVLIKPRAARALYDHAVLGDGAGVEDRSQLTGYSLLHTRGSDLTNSLADRKQLGFVTADGPFPVAGVISGLPIGQALKLTGLTATDPYVLASYRLRIVTSGGATIYAAVAWGDTTGAGAANIVTAWFIPGSVNPGDTAYLEVPGVVLYGALECRNIVLGTTSQGLHMAGLELGAGDVNLGSNDENFPGRYCGVRGGLVGLVGHTEADGVYVDESGTVGSFSSYGFAATAGLISYGHYNIILSYSSWRPLGSGDPSRLWGDSLNVNNCVWSDLSIEGFSGGISLTTNLCDLTATSPRGVAVVQHMALVPEWSRGLVCQAGDIEGYRNGACPAFTVSDLFTVSGAEPARPAITLKAGKYSVLFDFLAVGIGAGGINAGNGVRLEHTAAGTKFTSVSYASLLTTGFEVIGGQKVMVKYEGQGYEGDVLLCPRGRPMLVTDPFANPTPPPGTILSSVAGSDVLQSSSSEPGLHPRTIAGVSLTSWVETGGTQWAVVGTDTEMMVQRISSYVATPRAGQEMYLRVGDIGVGGSLNYYPAQSYTGVSIGTVSASGLLGSSGPVPILWKPNILKSRLSVLASNVTCVSLVTPVATALAVGCENGRTYEVDALLNCGAGAVGGVAATIQVGSIGPGMGEVSIVAVAPATALALEDILTFNTLSGVSGPTQCFIRIKCVFASMADQMVTVAFSQHVSNAVTTYLYAGSWMRVSEREDVP
jgi:hypothetical protein